MSSAVIKLSQLFLCGVPVTKIDFTDIVEDLTDDTSGVSNQDLLLSLTVDHPLVRRLPLKAEYQQSFMRKLLTQLEDKASEISDSLYERHIQILHSGNSEKVYRHFTLNDSSIISVRESLNIISNGTTGLYIWQAAHVLINWCFTNAELLRNSAVLELGCGVGLCGIAVTLLCNPSKYIFTDCHPAVMNALIENVKMNSAEESPTETVDIQFKDIADRVMWSGKLGESSIVVAHLPWEDVADQHLASVFSPKYVIASDLVYDPHLFESLSKTLKEFVEIGSQVILASTERNVSTFLDFSDKLGSIGLKLEEDVIPDACIVPVCSDWVVKVYRVIKN